MENLSRGSAVSLSDISFPQLRSWVGNHVSRRPAPDEETIMRDDPFEIANSSGLTDADWAEINKLRQTYDRGGPAALSKAMEELGQDPIRYVHIMGAIFPDLVREVIKDEMSEVGMTEEDLRELVRKLESPAPDQ